MHTTFRGTIIEWRGPSPYYFIVVPEKTCRDLRDMAGFVTYGWGMIPVTARIGATEWTTSLFPREGRYWVPIKDKVREAEGVDEGDRVRIQLALRSR
ncbi:MAG: DUF1905 domain-containing protein [Gemmatimonadetes bacterium]|nr:DUF1905 domain-containing protein [Gemmatimonadota bacterium]